MIEYIIVGGALTTVAVGSIVVVRPTERALIERMGKYHRFVQPGVTFKIPLVDSVIKVNITECMVNAAQQQVITQDNLNAVVDAQVYYKVKADEENVKKSQYSVNDYETQIIALARTTMRNTIGKMMFKDVNSKRDVLNDKLTAELKKEAANWGIEIVRTELKEIEPPKDVQETMNKVIKAENEKIAAIDFATAAETNADGQQRAVVKNAEGEARAIEMVATARATAVKLVSEASEKYFKERAEKQRQLEVLENTLGEGTVYVMSPDSPMLSVLPLASPRERGEGKRKRAVDSTTATAALSALNQMAQVNDSRVRRRKKEEE